MNPFGDLIPQQQNANPFADLIGKQKPQKTSIGQKVLNAGTKVTNFLGGGAIADTFGAEIAKLGATPQEKQFITQPTAKQTVGSAIQLGSTFLPVGGGAKAITTGAKALGLKTGASALGKIASGALLGEAFDVGANLQSGKTGIGALKPSFGTAIGAGIPAVGVGLNVAKRTASTVLPKLLSYTSDVPEKAFTTMLERRTPVVQAIEAGASPTSALKNTQVAVRALREDLSREWQDGVKQIADEFNNTRLGLSDKSAKKLASLVDDFGIEIPQNLKSASANEWINTLKSINELPKLLLSVSPKGNAIRVFKKDLQGLVTKTFGGEKGSVATLYKNYSAKKGVFDAANDIVRAYSTGKPIQQSTALNRLQTLFNENKPAYLDAILDLEKATGRDLLSEITASKFAPKLPPGGSAVSATSGILAPTGIVDKAIKLLLLPLSSPRSAGFLARNLGSRTPLGAIQGPGDVIAKTQLGQKIGGEIKDFAKNPKLGASIQDVAKNIDSKTGLTLGENGQIKQFPENKPTAYFEMKRLEAAKTNGFAKYWPEQWKRDAMDKYIEETNIRRLTRDEATGKSLEPNRASASYKQAEQVVKNAGNSIENPKFIPIKEATPEVNLTPEYKGIETKAFEKLKANPQGAVDAYKALPETKGGRVVNTDTARKIFSDVGYNGINAAAVQEPSSALAKVMYREGLKNKGDVVIYAGGSGTGKSSAVKGILNSVLDSAAVINDGNLSNIKSARKLIQQAHAVNKPVDIVYVYRNPIESYVDGVIKRMLTNTSEGGRVVPSSVVAKNHIDSYNVVKELSNDYIGGRVPGKMQFHLIDNSRGFGKADFMDMGKFYDVKYPSVSELHQQLIKETKKLYEQGTINKDQYEALIK